MAKDISSRSTVQSFKCSSFEIQTKSLWAQRHFFYELDIRISESLNLELLNRWTHRQSLRSRRALPCKIASLSDAEQLKACTFSAPSQSPRVYG